MSRLRLWLALFVVVIIGLVGTFNLFDVYQRRAAAELADATLRSEATTIQQGNLLQAFSKYESVVQSSGSLKGLAVYDLSLGQHEDVPLLKLGAGPARKESSAAEFERLGLFRHVLTRHLPSAMVIQFYFDPSFVFWSYALVSVLLLIFATTVGVLGGRISALRSEERAKAALAISQQVSHDIKSPLSAIRMFADVMAKRGHDTALLTSGVSRIEGILNDLHQGPPRDAKVSESDFDVSQAISEVIEEKLHEHPGFSIRHQGSAGAVVGGDVVQVKRVLSNLLNNAIEASEPSHAVEVLTEVTDEHVVVTIVDSGSGISSEAQSRLFERGYTFGKLGGSGLGLYYAQKVMTDLGGTIALESDVSRGTKVTLRWPVRSLN